MLEDRLKERRHVLRLVREFADSVARFCRGEYEGAVQLLVRGVQIHQKLEGLVDDFIRTRFRTVDFIDAYDDREVERQGLLRDKTGLRHGAFKRVDNKDDAVDHLQHALHFSAEIGVAGRVDDVDLCVLIGDCRILGQDCNSALPFNIARVHDALGHFLIRAEYAALPEQAVDERRFAVVDVGDDGNISDIFSGHMNPFPISLP